MSTLRSRHEATSLRDRIAFAFVKLLRYFTDLLFRERYGHRAVVLETIAAVPGMVGAMLQHLKSLRYLRDDHGWVRELLDEAENERMHLMTFVEISHPTLFERMLIMIAQAIFFGMYFVLYLLSPATAHRVVGYFEEEAVASYTSYLVEIDAGKLPNVAAPQIAIDYWQLGNEAKLRDVVVAVRADEAGHRDRNHRLASALVNGTVASVVFRRPMAMPASLHAVQNKPSDLEPERRAA